MCEQEEKKKKKNIGSLLIYFQIVTAAVSPTFDGSDIKFKFNDLFMILYYSLVILIYLY